MIQCSHLIRGLNLPSRSYKMYFLSVVILAVFASTTSALPPCVCTRDLKPVCGTDGVTYNNQCLLDCARTRKPELELARSGKCTSSKDMCICPLIYSPVCGSDGQTYPNECSLTCQAQFKDLKMVQAGDCARVKREAVLVAHLGKCDCSEEAKPVCGSDGNTYPNECTLNCAKEVNEDLHVESEGACIERDVPAIHDHDSSNHCPCPKNRKPVCGSDGVTYSNKCLLMCAGNLTVVKTGPCGHDSILRTEE